MSSPRRPIAIGNYDFRPSGTVAKSIEIATAAVEAGLPAELWVMRAQGPFRERVPGNVPIIELGPHNWSISSRSLDLALCLPAFSKSLRKRRPSLFLSGGNHLHLATKLSIYLSGCRKSLRYGLRASNSSSRPDAKGTVTNWAKFFLDRFKYRGADFVAAVSKDLADEIGEADASLNALCIPNGVDIERVRQLASEPFDHPFLDGRHEGRPVLVAMGRICRQKGFDILIRALGLLPLENGARLLIIGDGSRTEVEKLRDLAKAQRVSDRIDFVGYQKNPFAIMGKADLFVSASRWEGASNAINEALACGLPIVATDCPTGSREALKGGEYGALVPLDDPKALADGIIAELAAGRRRDMQLKAAEGLDLRICLNKWVELLRHEAALSKSEQRMPGDLA